MNNEIWDLAERPSAGGFLLLFYRGLHSSRCGHYLENLNRQLSEFTARGIEAIAISGDSKARAEQVFDTFDVGSLRIGYDLKISTMFEWGLFVSRSERFGDPQVFCEPGLFLINPDLVIALAIMRLNSQAGTD